MSTNNNLPPQGTPQFDHKLEKGSPSTESLQNNMNNLSFASPSSYIIPQTTKEPKTFTLFPSNNYQNPTPSRRSNSIFKDTNKIKEINQQQNEENTFFDLEEKSENKNKILDSQWVVNNLLMEKVTGLNTNLKDIADNRDKIKSENLIEKALLVLKKQRLEKQQQEEITKASYNYIEENQRLKTINNQMKAEMEQIEVERNRMKKILEDKYRTMKELKEKLNIYVERMNKIKKEIDSREFAMTDKSISYERGEMDFNFDSEENSLKINETYQKQ